MFGATLLQLLHDDEELHRLWSQSKEAVLDQCLQAHKQWELGRAGMAAKEKKEAKERLLLLRDALVLHYLMWSDEPPHRLLHRGSYMRWLHIMTDEQHGMNAELMNKLSHGFLRFVERKLVTTMADAHRRTL